MRTIQKAKWFRGLCAGLACLSVGCASAGGGSGRTAGNHAAPAARQGDLQDSAATADSEAQNFDRTERQGTVVGGSHSGR